MARVGSGDSLNIGTWADEDDPGAGAQSFDSTGKAGTGLNGNFVRFWAWLTAFFSGEGTVKNDVIDGNALKSSVVDGSTLEASAGTGSKNFRIKDGGVTEAKIASGAVTETKIGSGVVTAAKIATDAVETAKIKDANVTNAKLASGIDGSKLANNSVPTIKLGYREYAAVVSQSGSSHPVAQQLENHLGGTMTWTRISAGFYNIALGGGAQFITNRTVVMVTSVAAGAAAIVQASREDNTNVTVTTRNASGTGTDGLLIEASVIIRVYPETLPS